MLPNDVSFEQLNQGVAYTLQQPTTPGWFVQEFTWRVTPDGVEEEVGFTSGWAWGLLISVIIITMGSILHIESSFPVTFITGIQMVGLAGVVWLLLEALWAGYLSEEMVTFESMTAPYSGVLVLILVHGIAAILVASPLAILLSGIAFVLTLAYCRSSAVERRLAVLSAWLTDLQTTWPVAPRRHILFANIGSIALLGVSNLFVEVEFLDESLLLGVLAVGIVWILLFLWTVNSRLAARLHVGAAVGLTGMLVIAIPFITRPAITASQNIASPLAVIGQFLIGVVLMGLWWLLAKHQVHTQSDAIARFVSTGRQVDTETAAILAYGVIVSSALLGLGALVATGTMMLLITGGGHEIAVLVLIVSSLPFGYFVIGSTYQLRGLYRQMVEIRRRGARVSPADLDLPIDPEHDLWVVETDGFLAGAYYDPFLSVIVLSHGAIEMLSNEELAAVVAHEESHFVHRGAWLQFLFTLVCSFTLLGKNVVYSIYDFREREFTADQYAVERLLEPLGKESPNAILSVLDSHIEGKLYPPDSPLVGFFPTMTWASSQYRQHGRELFVLFYGSFAGQVHPAISERQNTLESEYGS